jgi:hypothetical protein
MHRLHPPIRHLGRNQITLVERQAFRRRKLVEKLMASDNPLPHLFDEIASAVRTRRRRGTSAEVAK